MRRVFLGSEAVEEGALTAHELRRWHQRLFRDVYLEKSNDVTLRDRIEGAGCDLAKASSRELQPRHCTMPNGLAMTSLSS